MHLFKTILSINIVFFLLILLKVNSIFNILFLLILRKVKNVRRAEIVLNINTAIYLLLVVLVAVLLIGREGCQKCD